MPHLRRRPPNQSASVNPNLCTRWVPGAGAGQRDVGIWHCEKNDGLVQPEGRPAKEEIAQFTEKTASRDFRATSACITGAVLCLYEVCFCFCFFPPVSLSDRCKMGRTPNNDQKKMSKVDFWFFFAW
ncbi:hypothetical protein BCV70DRAFT_72977 [Testicularia cyperi]|uniref:Uncharacterized protein n=1 Tax=Testicularia cyperi TaxID=1882483 RepID=A0A317XTF3_9BASI|nr:hypothetical protein BCV70DRAFT_72977 [Testicularia cyperi]